MYVSPLIYEEYVFNVVIPLDLFKTLYQVIINPDYHHNYSSFFSLFSPSTLISQEYSLCYSFTNHEHLHPALYLLG